MEAKMIIVAAPKDGGKLFPERPSPVIGRPKRQRGEAPIIIFCDPSRFSFDSRVHQYHILLDLRWPRSMLTLEYGVRTDASSCVRGPAMKRQIEFTVNGKQAALSVDPRRPLLDVLREELQLTGTKYGCGEGECGACTVLVNDAVVRSCITPIGEVLGKRVETIESLANGERLHAVQQAFVDEQAMQCGYCVPGQIMAATGLLRANPRPSRAEIVEAMSGNLCRCCNYVNLLAAVEKAATV
jgi:aerobic-type carbon monoxide dehydrogenase small subunit (CoxS/CutS family)